MFCVKCGKDCEEQINGLCMECFLNGRKLMVLPHHVDLQRCTNCEEFNIRDRWTKISEEDAVQDAALTGMLIIPEAEVVSVGTMAQAQDDRTYEVKVEADLAIGSYIVSANSSTLVRVKNNVCKRCSRQLGNYYEATMQIRSGEKELPDSLRDEIVRRIRDSVELQAKTNRQLFITKVQQVPGGVDIMLSSISLARSLTKDLVESYGAESKESASLVGQSNDGIDIYRLTYLVRFPAYHTGDVMEYNGRPYKLTGLNKTGGKLLSLTDFRETSVRKSEIQDLRILVKHSDRKEALVLSRSGNEIQVMHPTNYSTVDLRIPKDAEPAEGGTVDVVQVEDELYYLP
ncbi:MAG: hypothetical protein J6O90_01490 [Candidatus Methanomethylophilaceae archaeon]|nr:hypothetical protein [Candidatus Methanomethylophilaceae archaeon]